MCHQCLVFVYVLGAFLRYILKINPFLLATHNHKYTRLLFYIHIYMRYQYATRIRIIQSLSQFIEYLGMAVAMIETERASNQNKMRQNCGY